MIQPPGLPLFPIPTCVRGKPILNLCFPMTRDGGDQPMSAILAPPPLIPIPDWRRVQRPSSQVIPDWRVLQLPPPKLA